MRHARLVLLASFALFTAACSTPGGVTPSSAAAVATPTATTPTAATRIVVTLTDALRIEPATMTVPVGVPVTFVVTNAGLIDHEFYLGDEAAQAEHDREMAMGGMAHDEPAGIGLDPGETKELTYTFGETGEAVAGCHVVGHYAAGMRAAITIVP